MKLFLLLTLPEELQQLIWQNNYFAIPTKTYILYTLQKS